MKKLPGRSGPGAGDEDKIRYRRKQKLLIRHFEEKEEEFLPRMLTATSHINKLAALRAKVVLKGTDAENLVGHIPGSITAIFRNKWRLLELLAEISPELINIGGECRHKAEIRNISHMHHAVDAITLSLVRYKLPKIDKELARAILKRSPELHERETILATGLFDCDGSNKLHPRKIPKDISKTVRNALAEKRVVQHIPSTMRGMKCEQTIWGFLGINEKGKAEIRQRKDLPKRLPSGQRREIKIKAESPDKLLGNTDNKQSKLRRIKGVMILDTNYGVTLSETPQVIRYINVYKQLKELGFPKVLKKGHIIRVQKGRYKGIWMVRSIKDAKNGVLLRLSFPEYVEKKPEKLKKMGIVNPKIKDNVALKTLQKDGFALLESSPTGF